MRLLLLVPAAVEVWFAFVLFGWHDALNRRSKRLRTEVEALPGALAAAPPDRMILLSDVLALLDRSGSADYESKV